MNTPENRLTAATYNVYAGGYNFHGETGFPHREPRIVEAVKRLHPQFFGLVDTAFHDRYTDQEIARIFGYSYAHTADIDDSNSNTEDLRNVVGLTVLSDLPMKTEVLRIHDRNAIIASVVHDGFQIDFTTVYLRFPHTDDSIRVRETEELVRQLSDGTFQFVMGDFNSLDPLERRTFRSVYRIIKRFWPRLIPEKIGSQDDFISGSSIRKMKEAGFTDSETGRRKLPTFPTRLARWPVPFPVFRLDYGFFRGNNRAVSQVGTPTSGLYHQASDHLPKTFLITKR